jgi:hypothetical protein
MIFFAIEMKFNKKHSHRVETILLDLHQMLILWQNIHMKKINIRKKPQSDFPLYQKTILHIIDGRFISMYNRSAIIDKISNLIYR